MPFVIGLDEAGYGPNLGPLVIAATVWEVPHSPAEADFWSDLAPFIAQEKPRYSEQIQIADSKVVHNPQGNVGPLETGVLSAWAMNHPLPVCWKSWWPEITGTRWPDPLHEPWFACSALPLPQIQTRERLQTLGSRWNEICQQRGYRLCAQRAAIVLTRHFNELTARYQSKGLALSRLSLQLLQQLLPLTRGEPTLVLADKHGGRNRYDDLLAEITDAFIFRVSEGQQCSTYRWDAVEISFQTKSERFLPVALASMTAKYLRETAMYQFNSYWQAQVPGVLPTKGYPTDAQRFRRDVAEAVQRLGIAECDFWRAK